MGTPSAAPPGDAPYQVRLDPETARGLAEQGATLLMLGIPSGAYVGVDQQVFSAGPKYKGIKMIPPGTHFFSCRAVSTTGPAAGACAPPTGFFLHLAPRQVVIKVWDTVTEQLLDMRDEDEAQRYAEGVRRFDFDAFLAPYDLARYQQWSRLCHLVTAPVISALSPVGGSISVMAEAEDPELLQPKTEAERKLVQQLAEGRARLAQRQAEAEGSEAAAAAAEAGAAGDQGAPQPAASSGPSAMETDVGAPSSAPQATAAPPSPSAPAPRLQGGRCFYTRLPRLVKRHGLSAEELTALNMDKSRQLLQAVQERYEGRMEAVLGEMQFAFVAFVFGQSLDGFAQWKTLLMLLLDCEDATLHTHQSAFVTFLRVVRSQLSVTMGSETSGPSAAPAGDRGEAGQEAPFGLSMVEELLPDSFLRKMFGRFFRMLQENQGEVSSELQREAQALKQLLRSCLGWEYDIRVISGDLDDEDEDEDLPVIVDVNEPYAL